METNMAKPSVLCGKILFKVKDDKQKDEHRTMFFCTVSDDGELHQSVVEEALRRLSNLFGEGNLKNLELHPLDEEDAEAVAKSITVNL